MGLTEGEIREIDGLMAKRLAPLYGHITNVVKECTARRADVVHAEMALHQANCTSGKDLAEIKARVSGAGWAMGKLLAIVGGVIGAIAGLFAVFKH